MWLCVVALLRGFFGGCVGGAPFQTFGGRLSCFGLWSGLVTCRYGGFQVDQFTTLVLCYMSRVQVWGVGVPSIPHGLGNVASYSFGA